MNDNDGARYPATLLWPGWRYQRIRRIPRSVKRMGVVASNVLVRG